MQRYYIDSIKIDICNDSTYITDVPIVQFLNDMKVLKLNQDVTFIVGENGIGKSTLVEAIATCAGYNAEGGSKNFDFETRQTVSSLNHYINVIKKAYEKDGFFLRAETFYNVASQVDDLQLDLEGYGGKSLHKQSHGESFLSIIKNRFRGNGLYILDEPESALSPLSQLGLLAEINRLVNENSQLIITTHSPILLAFPNAVIYQVTLDGIEKISYEDCEHYKLTKQFLDNPKHFIKHLFDDTNSNQREG